MEFAEELVENIDKGFEVDKERLFEEVKKKLEDENQQ